MKRRPPPDYRARYLDLIGDLRAGVDALRAHPAAWRAYTAAIAESRKRRGQASDRAVDGILAEADAAIDASIRELSEELDGVVKDMQRGVRRG